MRTKNGCSDSRTQQVLEGLFFTAGLAFVLNASYAFADTVEVSQSYRLSATLILPSERPDWDYLALDEDNHHLFIAQRGDGATVVDTATWQRVKTLEDSAGANAIALAEPVDRGYVIN
jgi:hypothetical protein